MHDALASSLGEGKGIKIMSEQRPRCTVNSSDGLLCVRGLRHPGDHDFKLIDNRPQEIALKVPVNLPTALKFVKKWECLPYFPRSVEGMTALAEAVIKIAGDLDTALWLSDQVINGCPRCPTPVELRKIMDFKRGVPADGVSYRDYDNSQHMLGSGGKDQ